MVGAMVDDAMVDAMVDSMVDAMVEEPRQSEMFSSKCPHPCRGIPPLFLTNGAALRIRLKNCPNILVLYQVSKLPEVAIYVSCEFDRLSDLLLLISFASCVIFAVLFAVKK